MAHYRCDVRLPYETGLPRDVAINTFHFGIAGSIISGPQLDAIGEAMDAFYGAVPAGATEAVGEYISDYVDRLLCEISIYNVASTGPPVRNQALDVAAASSANSLPFEVAVCGSYYTDPEPGVPAASRRGRVYIGPLTNNAMTTSGGNPSRPSVDLVATIVGAMTVLAESAALAAEEVSWVVYSRTLDLGGVVGAGWVDNEFDTQRRRGTDATDRELWSIV